MADVGPGPARDVQLFHVRSLVAASAAVLRRPVLILIVYAGTLLVAVPVAALLSSAAEPALPGFAAPLDNLSAVFDLAGRPAQAIAGAVAYGLIWVLLWGAVLDAFARGGRGRGLVNGATAFLPSMIKLSLVAAGAYAVVFLVVHPILLGWLFGALTANVDSERTAFVIRVALYAVLALVLAPISLVIDYARVQTVVSGRTHTFEALAAAVHFVRRHAAQVMALAGAMLVCFAGLLFAYYAFDRITRGAPSLISFLVVGQGFILGRLVLRLVYAAAEVDLVIASRTADTTSGAVARSE